MAVYLIGDNAVCKKYVELKKGLAEKLGATFCLYQIEDIEEEKTILDSIKYLNNDEKTDGIMIQIPVSDKFNRDTLIAAIDPKKDIDGLRYCLGLESNFKPPVVMSILKALEKSGKDLKKGKIVLIGHGFLVGAPLARALKDEGINVEIIDSGAKNSETMNNLTNFDVIISATGKANLIRPEMIKDGVVLIDAGTAEQNGALVGDIDPECYDKSAFYTPVPGGIGPVTTAMLFQNLLSVNEKRENG